MTFKDLDKIINSDSKKKEEEEQSAKEEEQRRIEYENRRRLFITDEDYEKESKFAWYRHLRAHKKTPFGELTYADVYDSITQEELDWGLEHKLGRGFITPEQRYQDKKRAWYSHESSWFTRNKGKGGYDGHGCNQYSGCVPDCRYYSDAGRIEDSEVIAEHQQHVNKLRAEGRIVQAPTLV